jgi:putative hydrolase of the HAD superfamily
MSGVIIIKPQTILFDLDDTLVHCNKFFDLVLEQFADCMVTWFSSYHLQSEQIKQRQLELDLVGVQIHGFVPERFPASLVETYHSFCDEFGQIRVPSDEEFLYKLGHSVYSFKVEPYPDMHETLTTLQESGHYLYLYTGGDPSIQMRKVMDAGLEAYFGEKLFITLHKTTEFMAALIQENGFDRHNTWMIGNSLRTDVVPALANGINAIFIPVERDWKYNQVEIDIQPQGAFLKVPSLKQVPSEIWTYTTNMRQVN